VSEINFSEDIAPALIKHEVRVIRGGDYHRQLRPTPADPGPARAWHRA
jgi:hypothetical protein